MTIDSEPAEFAENRIMACGLLLFGAVFSSLTFVTITPALPSIAKFFAANGDNTLRAQFVLTMAVLGMTVGGVAAGPIASRLGVKRAAVLALVGCGVFGLAILFLSNIHLLYIDRFLLGWSAVTVDVCVISMLGARYEGTTRAKLIGFRQAIASISTVVGTLAAGALVQQYGWRTPSLVFSAAFPYAILILFVLYDRKTSKMEITRTPSISIVSSVWILYFLVIVQAIANTMPHFQLPFLLTEDGMSNAATMSRFPAASSVISIMSALAFGWIYSKLRSHTATVALVVMGVSFVVIGLTSDFSIVLGAIMLEGAGGGLMLPYLSSRILERVPQERRAHAYGSLMSILFMGQFLNPLVIAPIRLSLGIHGAFGVIGGVVIIIAVAMPHLIKLSERFAGVPSNGKVA